MTGKKVLKNTRRYEGNETIYSNYGHVVSAADFGGRPITMSGGEQQMLAVARGLMAQPEILMIDELSLGLAPFLVLDLFEILKQIKNEGLTMLLVGQNVQKALAVSDYAYVLAEGRVKMEGPSRELAKNQHIREAYLGI